MADPVSLDPNPVLRAELLAALGVLSPQIRGLEDLQNVSISLDLGAFVADQLDSHRRRRDLIVATLGGLDAVLGERTALAVDGYPGTPSGQMIPDHVFRELQEQMADLEKAAAIFEVEGPLTMTVRTGPLARSSPTASVVAKGAFVP